MEEITNWLQQPGVQGLVFHRGEKIAVNHFPRLYGTAAIEEMCGSIASACSAYARVGRNLTQQIIQFAEGTLLILASPPAGNALPDPEMVTWPFVTFLLDTPDAAPRLLGPARAFLVQQSRIDQEAWLKFEKELATILAKVINRAQGQKLISRVQKSFAPDQSGGLPRGKFADFGAALIREIPNRAKHDALHASITKLIANLDSL
jgi:hypothetical protein